MTDAQNSASDAHALALDNAFARLGRAARPAAEAAISAHLASYDRHRALARFHRLTPGVIAAETPDAARAVVREIARALRAERARRGHWTYDLNRHIALVVAHRAESDRAARLEARA